MNGAALTPVTWPKLTEELADRIAALEPADGSAWPRVAIDGATAADPGGPAAALAELLPARGRPVLRISTADFLRPASLRLEYGHQDPDAYVDLWLDAGALWREVFGRLGTDGDGRVLPTLRDPVTDRSTRAGYVTLPPGGVLLLDGPLLLGHGFPFDLAVHLMMTPAALERRTPPAEHWTLPALRRYDEEVRPGECADVLVRCDDPRRPAWTG
ncbi:uridine kinase [Streptomyces sp. SL13]|uniref:Uridine kinase n=1 Tax=Streptantibioticus silvisoli TaxID=2705255 RepID=A0AA90KAC7_9ACTN|nr:uridine kinase [Streptantibioticus silvisoli]MDI5966084.1 uridine kinase [Streptantibioticus silvisoli]MDI5971952.1 uridine kinase [Streptantibioticus silvisoli]